MDITGLQFIAALFASGIVGFIIGVFVASILRSGKDYDEEAQRDYDNLKNLN